VSQVDSFGYRTLAGFHWICMFSQDLDFGLNLVSKECFFVTFRVFPSLLFSFANRLFGTWRISGPSFVLSSLPPFLIGLFTLFGTPWAKGGVLARDLARLLVWHSGAYSPQRPKAAGMRPVV